MSFNYLNYARYLLAKLGSLDTVSKPVCDAKAKVSQLASDMITYYNSISKVIYGASSVTDVTPTGDLNGFRAMSAASVTGILKSLSYYEPVFRLGPGSLSTQVLSSEYNHITGLNARLDGTIEDQNRLQIDTGIIDGVKCPYMVSIAWVPYTGVIFSAIAVPLPQTSVRPGCFGFDTIEDVHCIPQRIGRGTRETLMWIRDTDREGSPENISLELVCYNADIHHADLLMTSFGDNAYCYLGPKVLDDAPTVEITDAQKPHIMSMLDNGVDRFRRLADETGGSGETVSYVTNFPKLALQTYPKPTMAQAWGDRNNEPLRYTPHTQYVMADTRAMNLMFLLINDILAEINFS